MCPQTSPDLLDAIDRLVGWTYMKRVIGSREEDEIRTELDQKGRQGDKLPKCPHGRSQVRFRENHHPHDNLDLPIFSTDAILPVMATRTQPDEHERIRPGPPSPYPWDKWCDGSWWHVKRGEDYTVVTKSFRATAFKYAKRHGYALRTHVVGDGMIMRMERQETTRGGSA